MINEKEESSIHIYPNPFSKSITIEFEKNSPGPIEIAIFNHLGQLLETVNMGNIKQGKHHYLWDATDLYDGVYFVHLMAGKEVDIRKTIKMK